MSDTPRGAQICCQAHQLVLTSSHSTGTAVRSTGSPRRRPSSGPDRSVGRGRVARSVPTTRFCATITALASAGTGHRDRRRGSSWRCVPAGSIAAMRADLHPDDADLVTGVDRGGAGEVGGDRLRREERLSDNDDRTAASKHDQGPQAAASTVRWRVIARPHCSPGIPLYGKGSSARGPALSGGCPALMPRRNPNA